MLRQNLIQAKLAVGQPGDRYEQEADKVADAVLRMPAPGLGLRAQGQSGDTPIRIQRMCDECEEEMQRQPDEEEEIAMQAKQAPGADFELSRGLESQIDALKGGGQPLPESLKDFFEPRFDQDFSQVRIHTDSRAASSARAVNALAFTVGRDVVFGAGQFSPETPEGKRLLAHELTHVVQQGGSNDFNTSGESKGTQSNGTTAARLSRAAIPLSHSGVRLQRAKIPHIDLTWGDFKGKPKAKSKFDALTATEIGGLKKWSPKSEITATGQDCTREVTSKKKTVEKKDKEYNVKLTIDPSIFDRVTAVMVQEKSWVKSWAPDNGHAQCLNDAGKCESYFNAQPAKATKACKEHVKPCQKAFDEGSTSYSLKFDDKDVEVTTRAECSTKLVSECRDALVEGVSYSLTQDQGAGPVDVASADTKKDCKKDFYKQCVDNRKEMSEKLLAHEQGHFDIAETMANKIRNALVAEAATWTVDEIRCGKAAANSRAKEALKAINNLWKDGFKREGEAQKDYDDETTHGLEEDKQAEWVEKISGGLTDYEVP